MATAPKVEADFLSPLGEGALLFRRMVAREELGRLPEYRIELLRDAEKKTVEAKELLGVKVGLQLLTGKNTYRHINGFVTRFEHGGVLGRFDIYRIELRPWLWQLTLGADCRIFQDKTAVQVIEAVFSEYGTAGPIEKKLSATHRKRPYTVQYRESDFNFISRLMEEEGIYYYFKHVQGQHTLVMTDGPSGHAAIEGDKLSWAQTKKGEQLREDVVTQWSCSHALQSLKYTHTDFAAEKPTLDLKAEATRTAPYAKPNDLEVFDYPGGYDDLSMDGAPNPRKTEGTRLAAMQVDRFESGHVVARGSTPYRHTAAGFNFSFDGHGDAGSYLIYRSDFEMEHFGYEADGNQVGTAFTCRFEAVPKAVRYQPQPQAERPLIHGPQTATVVGPSGDEIATDKYGRVKLQFRWDRVGTKNEKSSCWVRVSHPWASKQFGMIALPRIGDEVVVEFLEGNPDRPLITGRVYNGDNMPPYELPAQATVSGIKSQSSKGGSLANANELRLDDKKGSEYVWFQAEKDFHRWVKNDAYDTVKNDNWADITKNAYLKIGENYTVDIGKETTLKIGMDVHAQLEADLNTGVKGAFNLKVDNAVAMKGAQAIAVTAGQGIDVDAGQAINLSAASSIHIKGQGIVIDGGTQLCIKAGGAFVILGPEGVTISGTVVKINSGGSAGTANPAQQANPPVPKAPVAPKVNEDPLAKK